MTCAWCHDKCRPLEDAEHEAREQKRKRLIVEMNLKFMEKKLHAVNRTVRPVVVDVDEVECKECYYRLEEDFAFCPGCGCWIEWDNAERVMHV